jgi:hypothetical protein
MWRRGVDVEISEARRLKTSGYNLPLGDHVNVDYCVGASVSVDESTA